MVDEIFLGVDLSTQPKTTGLAKVRDETDVVVLEDARCGVTDDEIVEEISAVAKAGIDVPLGWPQPFVSFLAAQCRGELPPPADTGIEWRH